ncbi:MAG TPA: 3-hydroxyanthranilate 3,4-dioxygenase [Burkholderiales bacterium]|nr:3-hydroxyanthranilate 3,4-dioxygenase [Burkholderiales bacterium]
MMELAAFSLKNWIEEHRHLLKPPVGNQLVWKDQDLMVMIVGGPNQRKDFHVNPTAEFFHQIEGDMVLKIMEDGKIRGVPIRQGDVFLLPPNVPHSPQRPANTIGMVVETKRPEGKEDHMRFYCDACGGLLYDASFILVDLSTQLKPVIEKFWADEQLRTCKACGTTLQPA